jgi:regulator of replication initiation timing
MKMDHDTILETLDMLRNEVEQLKQRCSETSDALSQVTENQSGMKLEFQSHRDDLQKVLRGVTSYPVQDSIRPVQAEAIGQHDELHNVGVAQDVAESGRTVSLVFPAGFNFGTSGDFLEGAVGAKEPSKFIAKLACRLRF